MNVNENSFFNNFILENGYSYIMYYGELWFSLPQSIASAVFCRPVAISKTFIPAFFNVTHHQNNKTKLSTDGEICRWRPAITSIWETANDDLQWKSAVYLTNNRKSYYLHDLGTGCWVLMSEYKTTHPYINVICLVLTVFYSHSMYQDINIGS